MTLANAFVKDHLEWRFVQPLRLECPSPLPRVTKVANANAPRTLQSSNAQRVQYNHSHSSSYRREAIARLVDQYTRK